MHAPNTPPAYHFHARNTVSTTCRLQLRSPCSEEIVRSWLLGGHAASLLRRGLEDLEVLCAVLVELKDRRNVAAAVAVVGRGEYGDHVAVMAPGVPFHRKLVGAGDKLEAVVVVELFRDVLTEGVPRPTRRDAPPATIVRVRPHHVTHRPLMGDLLARELPDVVERVHRGGEAAVDGEQLVLYQRRERQIVKQVSEDLPHVCVAVLPKALIIEAVDLCDLSTLVVAAQ
mmetsp:Transcript_16912/g.34253  ORF Transcript_16912/g.34253 Transcript_16912/m.34253 type:complete len:228 (-) Transcript_16912:248-931(-)